ncbi:hypothetical protein AV530_005847 [Patagioenas fasciata monilis]|uniref:Uncharacterized protein n=1 Tax=Patagioenas fasciata monilis TaxID=372326 RepID=A0A1V4JMV2_PATFA|nr:hypothetical protein AV530_005847 [Patagioenas fasciata monilis]
MKSQNKLLIKARIPEEKGNSDFYFVPEVNLHKCKGPGEDRRSSFRQSNLSNPTMEKGLMGSSALRGPQGEQPDLSPRVMWRSAETEEE